MVRELETKSRPSIPNNPEGKMEKWKSSVENVMEFMGDISQQIDAPQNDLIFEKPSIKQRFKNKLKEKQLSIKEKLEKPFIAAGTAIFVPLVERSIVRTVKPEYPKGFDNAFMELAKDPSTLFIYISNHTGHADVAGTAVISKRLTKLANKVRPENNRFRGFLLTIASSLETAHQSVFLQQCTRRAKTMLERKYSLPMSAYTRKKDMEKYHIDSRSNRQYAEDIGKITMGSDDRKADAQAYYIEGTVEGGRRVKEGENTGQIKGTQKIDCEQLLMLINKAQSRYGRKVAYIIGSSEGANEILDPDQGNRPTRKAVMTIINPITPNRSLLSVKVGMPIPHDDLIHQISCRTGREVTVEDFNEEIGKRMSSGLSFGKRGYYK